MKAAELIQSERKKVEEVAMNASQLIQKEIKKVSADLRVEFLADISKRTTKTEASATSSETKASQRILDELGLRLDKVESTLLQNAQVGLRFHALESEVKA